MGCTPRNPDSKPSAHQNPALTKAGFLILEYPQMERFETCLAFTWLPQNDGQPLHVTPGDRGGATAWGVTLASYAAWRSDHGIHATTAADLGRATQAELSELIRSRYWLAVSADSLPVGADLLTYDFGYGSGPGTSCRVLQAVLGVVQDGQLGPVTLAAAARMDRTTLVRALAARHAAYYESLSDFRLFGHGWLNRNAARLALALAAKPAVPTQAPAPEMVVNLVADTTDIANENELEALNGAVI